MAGPSHSVPDVAAMRLAALGLATLPVTDHDGAFDTFVGGWVPEDLVQSGTSSNAGSSSSGAARHARPAGDRPGLSAVVGDRLPPWLTSAVAPSATAMLWLVAVCALCIGVTGYTLLHSRTAPEPAAPAVPAATFAPLPSPTPPSIVVDVGGRVRRPGLVTVPVGSRVADALRAAGGALRPRDLLTLNLAAKVTDGQLLLVGVPATSVAGAGAPGTTDGASTAATGPVDLNSATAEQLDTLPGIGPVLAQHILDWRTAHGGFRSVDQLRDVSGIGDSTFADLAPLVTV